MHCLTAYEPMTSDLDIYRSAKQLIDQYGEDAPTEAAMRADQFGAQNNYAAYATWVKIKAAAKELLKEQPDAEVH